ncbi:G-protein coupled receptor Mth2-like isoform X2 [Artemia franciscana]
MKLKTFFALLYIVSASEEEVDFSLSRAVPIHMCCSGSDCTYDENLLKKYIPVKQGTHAIEEVLENFYFNITAKNFECGDEILRFRNKDSVKEFELFQDGTLWTKGSSKINVPLLDVNKYCIEQKEDSSVARACVVNTCQESICIKKCCPAGFTVDGAGGCIADNLIDWKLPKTFVDTDLNEVAVDEDKVKVVDHYMPWCDFGEGSFLALYGYAEDFHFLAKGGIFIPSLPSGDQINLDYCTDGHVDNGTVLLESIALVCTQSMSHSTSKIIITQWILPILMQISGIFLLLTFTVYAILPELHTLHGKTIMCHVGSMWVYFTCAGIMNLTPIGYNHGLINTCFVIAYLMLFSFLSAFTWLCIMGFDICWTFRHPDAENKFWHEIIFGRIYSFQTESDEIVEEVSSVGAVNSRKDTKKFTLYSTVAFGISLTITIVGLAFDLVDRKDPHSLPYWIIPPGIGQWSCWFHSTKSTWIYLYAPLSVMLAFNILMFGLTAPKIYDASKNAAKLSPGDTELAKERLKAIVKLSVLMGLTWIMEAISFAIGGEAYYWLVTDLVNILMPICIFFLFIWKKKILEMLAARYSCFRRVLGRSVYKRPSSYTGSSGATTSTSVRPSSRIVLDESAKMISDR